VKNQSFTSLLLIKIVLIEWTCIVEIIIFNIF